MSKGKRPKQMVFYPQGIADGCSQFRFEWPRQTLNTTRSAEIQTSTVVHELMVDGPHGNKVPNPLYVNSDVVVMQRPVIPKYVSIADSLNNFQNFLADKTKVRPFKFIIDIDDVINGKDISDFNFAKSGFANGDRFKIFTDVVHRSDELHTASPAMQKYYRDILKFDKVLYRPNLLPKYLYDGFYDETIIQERYERNRPRIVWAGSPSHIDVTGQNKNKDDFSQIRKFIEKTKHKYQWVFYGAHPKGFETDIENGVFEYYPWTSIMEYPQKLWSLEPTIFIAPLEDNVFNRCKSNIKLSELGAMGIAGIYQNLEPYEEAPLKYDTVDGLEGHIEYLLNDWDHYLKVIRQMRKYSEDYFMEDNIDLLMASYILPYGSPLRDKYCLKLNQIQAR